jgi:single-strand DNA-binding protein
MNHVVLSGRLTRSPEVTVMKNGKTRAYFTLAVDKNHKAKEGETNAYFIPCTVFGNLAENFSKLCDKGTLIGVEGTLSIYEKMDGDNRRIYPSVLVNRFELFETRETIERRKNKSAGEVKVMQELTVDDLPF